jgi:hypothetical protein
MTCCCPHNPQHQTPVLHRCLLPLQPLPHKFIFFFPCCFCVMGANRPSTKRKGVLVSTVAHGISNSGCSAVHPLPIDDTQHATRARQEMHYRQPCYFRVAQQEAPRKVPPTVSELRARCCLLFVYMQKQPQNNAWEMKGHHANRDRLEASSMTGSPWACSWSNQVCDNRPLSYCIIGCLPSPLVPTIC